MQSKNKTKLYIIVGLSLWMVSLFFFLKQSANERSLVFAHVGKFGWLSLKDFKLNFKKKSLIDDPNIVPILYIVDSLDFKYDSSIVKNAFSLRQYAPPVMSQGQLGSCVAWASGYAGLTIVKRIETNNINFEPISPLNLFVRYKKMFKESPCSYGACIPVALNILKKKGCDLFKNFPNNCEGNVSEKSEFKDKLYDFDEINSNDISKIKAALSAKIPIVIAVKCFSGDSWQNAVLDHGVWNGYYSGEDNGGAHAMCLIGYDDNKGGGSFEIMNSWGEEWGDKGFFWIKYKDFPIHVIECYALVSKSKVK